MFTTHRIPEGKVRGRGKSKEKRRVEERDGQGEKKVPELVLIQGGHFAVNWLRNQLDDVSCAVPKVN